MMIYRCYLFSCIFLISLRNYTCFTVSKAVSDFGCRTKLMMAGCRVLSARGRPLPLSCMNLPPVTPPDDLQVESCQEIHCAFPSAPSGYYRIHPPNGPAVEVYCDMEGSNCGGEGGWTRVAYVNMTEPDASCPEGLIQKNFSGLILCGKNTTGCESTFFSTLGLNYGQVCGRLRGYQLGTPEAFSLSTLISSLTIDSQYFDGASITYGSNPRTHIWSYAVGRIASSASRFGCPCNNGSTVQTPAFVGNDYYCESVATSTISVFYPNDPLWDGQQCSDLEPPCCTNPNLPWFTKTLDATTNEDIELRLCQDEDITVEGSPLELIEMFVR